MGNIRPEPAFGLERFDQNRVEAAGDFRYETLKGIDESPRKFF